MIASVPNVLLKSSLVVLLAMSCSVSGAVAAKTAPTQKAVQRHALTNSELVEILRTAKVTDGSYSLTATQTGDELIVSTQQNPKFNENDTKVQGVLIAKTAFDVLPDSIQRTKILFHDPEGGSINEVLINRTVIETYGKGQMDEKKLLGSLELEKKSGEQTSEAPEKGVAVVAGPMEDQRMIMLTRIEYMKKMGAEVSKPESEFAEAEKLATANDHDGLKAKLTEIKNILDEQKIALKSAQKASMGQSVGWIGGGGGGAAGGAGKGKRQEKRGDYIGSLIHFLKSKGVSVDAEERQYDSTKKSNNPGMSIKDKRQARAPLAEALNAKLSKLPAKDQQEFKNFELSSIGLKSPNDNGSTSNVPHRQAFGNFRKRLDDRMQATGGNTGNH
jgi:hypothetical protein